MALSLALSVPFAATAAAQRQGTPEEFVQAFYDWYAPFFENHGSGSPSLPADVAAIRLRPALFSRALAAMIEDDWRAQSRCAGYIVGLDYDPFLQAQDSEGGRFRVTGAAKTAAGYRVSVSFDGKPVVFADVAGRAGHWRFIDFSDRDGSSVTAALKSLAKGDRSCPKD